MASKTICASCMRTMRLQSRNAIPFMSKRVLPAASSTRTQPSRILNTATTARRQLSTSLPSRSSQKQPPPPAAEQPLSRNQRNALTSFAAQVRKSESLKSTTEPYIAYGTTETLFHECQTQCSYTIPARLQQPAAAPPRTEDGEDLGEGEGWWYQSKQAGGLGLDVTFNTWAQVMFLHMYMLTARLRCFPAEHARIWHQNLLDHFFYAAEDRMAVWHGMSARGVRNKYLKDLWQQWRGVLISYDEGLIKGDAVLAAAIWRNVFKASLETDVADLALVTAYMRSQLRMLDQLNDEQVAAGEVNFGSPGAMERAALKESPVMMRERVKEDNVDGKSD